MGLSLQSGFHRTWRGNEEQLERVILNICRRSRIRCEAEECMGLERDQAGARQVKPGPDRMTISETQAREAEIRPTANGVAGTKTTNPACSAALTPAPGRKP